ncbi:sciellin [Xenentodon cancila]
MIIFSSSEPEEVKPTKPKSTSVQALSKRFSASQDELRTRAENKPSNTLISSPMKDDSSTRDSKTTVTTTETVMAESSTDKCDNFSSNRKSLSYSRPDSSYKYTSITSPAVFTSTPYRSRSEDTLVDPLYPKSSVKSVYASPERPVLEKDLCSSCHKPFTGDAKMVLEDMRIKCHAACFKCNVCDSTLGNLKAGDTMWIYNRMVHCENCFEITRGKWRR